MLDIKIIGNTLINLGLAKLPLWNDFYARKLSHFSFFYMFCFMNDTVKQKNTLRLLIIVNYLIVHFMKNNTFKGVSKKDFEVGLYCIILFLSTFLPISCSKNHFLTFFICDPLAAVIGRNFPIYRFQNNKSIGGSIAFSTSCYLITNNMYFSVFLATVEQFTNEYDNLTIGAFSLLSTIWN